MMRFCANFPRFSLRLGALLFAMTIFAGFMTTAGYARPVTSEQPAIAHTTYAPCQAHEVRVKFEGGYFCLAAGADGAYMLLQQVCAGDGVIAQVYQGKGTAATPVPSNKCVSFFGPGYIRVSR